MRSLVLLTILLFAGFAPQEMQTPRAKSEPELYEDAEAYNIYAVLLPQDWTSRVAKASCLAIEQQTNRFPHEPSNSTCIVLNEESKKDWQEVIDDYLKNNQFPRLLARKFPLEKPYELLTPAQVSAVITGKKAEDGWTALDMRCRNYGGLIELSAVGFNRAKDRAIVYMGHWCGGLCGGGTHYFLEKKNGKWARANVAARKCFWAS